MKQFQYTVQAQHGLHGRPAMQLVNLIKSLDSCVTVSCGQSTCDGSKLMALMMLDIQQGQCVTVRVQGGNEEENQSKLAEFFAANL